MHITWSDGRHFTIKPKHHTDTKEVQFKHKLIKQIKKLARKKEVDLFAVRVAQQLKFLHVVHEYQDISDKYEENFLDELFDKLPPLSDVN